MKQVLVIQTAFLGDAVLVTSILEKLHAHYPDAAIDLVVRKGNEGLFSGHPFLHRVHVWDKRQGKTRALFRLIGELRKTRYDHIINAQRFFSTGLMTVLARGKERVGYDKNPLSFLFTRKVKHVIGPAVTLSPPVPSKVEGSKGVSDHATVRRAHRDSLHEVDRLNALIEHLTDGKRPLPRLYPDEKASSDAHHLIDPSSDLAFAKPSAKQGHLICIAPASVWYTKQWPAEKWVELIKALPAEATIALIGAPGDVPLCERIAQEAGRGEVLAGKLSLLGTAALMARATMNYVNDSAPLHIASAMHGPVTAVFCSTVPAFGFGPLRENGRIVETTEQLDCRPCGLHGYKACPLGHFKCAWGIEVDALTNS